MVTQHNFSVTFVGKPDLPKWMIVAIINIASARNACNIKKCPVIIVILW